MKNILPFDIVDVRGRELLIPYMGNSSYVVTAAIRHFGGRASVLPTGRGYDLAGKYLQSEVCHPLKIVTGDILSFLNKKSEEFGKKHVEKNYLVGMPTTCGPCRFGKYQEVIRGFMDDEGYGRVPIGGPTTSTDYSDILDGSYSRWNHVNLQRILMKGVIACDMLDDITLRVRPYVDDKNTINKLRDEQLSILEKIVEQGDFTKRYVNWGRETVDKFEKHLTNRERFPLVVYSGEIYVRQHDLSTGNVIEKLEEQGLEIVRNPIIEWVDYVNKVNRIDSRIGVSRAIGHFDFGKTLKNIKNLSLQMAKGIYINNVHQKINKPFYEILKGRHDLPKPLELIRALEKDDEFNEQIRGEAALSIGLAHHLMNKNIGDENSIVGMFHVGPFTCMQEGVATAKIEGMVKELRKKRSDLLFPIVHAYFGDSPNPNLDSEIAVFREQCYTKKRLIDD